MGGAGVGGAGGMIAVGGAGGMGGAGVGGAGGMIAVGGAGGMGGAGVGGAGGMLGMGGAGGAPGAFACGDIDVVDYVAVADDSTPDFWILPADDTGAADVGPASCGEATTAAVFGFTAQLPGFYIFGTPGETDFDTVIFARGACPGDPAESELACDDDSSEGLTSIIGAELDANETIFLFVGAFQDAPIGVFDLRARRFDLADEGEQCGSGDLPRCLDGLTCRARGFADQALADEGECAPSAVPAILEGAAFTDGADRYTIVVDGADASFDVEGSIFELVDANGEALIIDAPDGTELIAEPVVPVFGESEFTARFRGDGLEFLPDAVGVRIRLFDSEGNESDPLNLQFQPLPEVQMGLACDPTRTEDACPEGMACLDADQDGRGGCAEATAPVVDDLDFFRNPANRSLGLILDGRDPDNDVVGFSFIFVDGQGNTVPVGGEDQFTLRFDELVQAEGLHTGTWSLFLVGPEFDDIAGIALITFDRQLLASEQANAQARLPPVRPNGLPCDYREALDRCEAGSVCFDFDEVAPFEPTCQVAPIDCGDEREVIVLDEQRAGLGQWFLEDDNLSTESGDGATCGGGDAGERYLEFTAPAARRYDFTFEADYDLAIYVRDACRDFGPRSERLCEAGDAGEVLTFSLELEADETVYLVVDGVSGAEDEKSAHGRYSVQVVAAP
jgi:hypothetical protein